MIPRGCWVRSRSSGTSRCALGAVEFIQVLLVLPGAPLRSLDSFGFVWFVRVRTGGYWVHSGSSGSYRCDLGVAEFVHVSLVRPSAPWGSLRSLGFVWFVRWRPGGCWDR